MISIQELSLSFGVQDILLHCSVNIHPKERIGLIGPNGCGKSTLFKLLANTLTPDSGSINIPKHTTIGYLPQAGFISSDEPLFQWVQAADKDLTTLHHEIITAETELQRANASAEHYKKWADKLDDLRTQYSLKGGDTWQADTAKILKGLGFNEQHWNDSCTTFSGGWQMRISLARLLLQKPDYLLLDEPTNHLDMESRAWLQHFINDYHGTIIVVSHDKYFLDHVVDKIWAFENKRIVEYASNYSAYELEKAQKEQLFSEMQAKQQKEMLRIRQFVDRFRYKASKASQVQSRIKALQKLQTQTQSERPKIAHIAFPAAKPCSKTVLRVTELSKSYDDTAVFRDAKLSVARGEKIAILGPNGAGKSTLLRLLAQKEGCDSGSIEYGEHVSVAYFAQDQLQNLKLDHTVMQELQSTAPQLADNQIRSLLGAFLFGKYDIDKPIRVISGGERNRVALAKVVVNPANLSLGDEATNHLDLATKEQLVQSLKDYDGTVLFVSHDREFVSSLAKHIIEVGHGKLTYYPENMEDFLWRKAQELGHTEHREPGIPAPDLWLLQAQASAKGHSSANSQSSSPKGSKREQYRSQVREQRQRKRMQEEIDTLMEQIDTKEGEIKSLKKQMQDPKQSSQYEQLIQLQNEVDRCEQEVEQHYERWQKLHEQLANAK